MIKRLIVAGVLAVLTVVGAASVASAQEAVRVQRQEVERHAGEVVRVRGNMLTLRREAGGRELYRIPPGTSISIEGVETRLQDLVPGQQIRVYVTRTEEGWVIVDRPPDVPEEPMAAAPPPPPPPAALPDTASIVPLLGLLGAGSLVAGLGMRARRRRKG